MKAALRVDASRTIGTGHLRRCGALAHALRDAGVQVHFVVRDLGIDAADWLHGEGFEARVLPAPQAGAHAAETSRSVHAAWAGVDSATDAAQTVQSLQGQQIDWLVIDHYAFDQAWHELVATALGCRIAVIDDLADRDLAAAMLVDHNAHTDHRAKYGTHLPATARLLGGPRFALLGNAYAGARRYEVHERVRSIGVFMGGVDACNASAAMLAGIETAGFDGDVEVVTTSANPHLDTLRRAVSSRARTTLSVDLADLTAFFARHDLQIGAGGGATWERCCIGAPTLGVVVADNQLAVVPALVELGVLATARPPTSLDPAVLAMAIRALVDVAPRRHTLAMRSREVVDGLGARRVALCMAADNLAVRTARLDDAAMLHRWRNHPDTRRVSRDAREIGFTEHELWLRRTLDDPARTLLVGEVGRIPVGVIRFDRIDDTAAEVSLYLDPQLHGLGLGAALLRAGEARMPPHLALHAAVLDGNDPSARLFAGAGYTCTAPGTWVKPAAAATPSPAPSSLSPSTTP